MAEDDFEKKYRAASDHKDDSDSDDEDEDDDAPGSSSPRSLRSSLKKSNAEKEPEDKKEKESNPDDEELSSEELQLAVLELVEDRTEEVQQEIETVPPDSLEEAEALAAAVYMEDLRSAFTEGTEALAADDITKAADEVIVDLALETDTSEVPASEPSASREAVATDEEVPAKHGEALTAASDPEMSAVEEPARIAVEPVPVVAHTSPFTPLPRYETSYPTLDVPSRSSETTVYPRRRNDLVVGLVVGYLVGRRKGRKNSERVSEPLRKKLEVQVSGLQQTIDQQEQRIRHLTRETLKHNPQITETFVQKLERRQERIEQKRAAARAEWIAQKPSMEKLVKLTTKESQVLLEKRKIAENEASITKRVPIEKMSVDELREIAVRIKFAGNTLDKLYEQKRISVEDMRQVVKEFLRGGSYERTLSEKILPDPEVIAEKQQKIQLIHGASASAAFRPADDRVQSAAHPDSTNEKQTASESPEISQPQQPEKSSVVVIVVVVVLLAVLLLIRNYQR